MKLSFLFILLFVLPFISAVGINNPTIPSIPKAQSINNSYYNNTYITNNITNNYYTSLENVALTNQSNTWADGENNTMGIGGWFKGAFNWVISSLTSSSVATFNGTTLYINDTYFYNQTVSTANFVPYENAIHNVNLSNNNLYFDNGSIGFSEGIGIKDLFFMNHIGGDGFRLQYWYDFELVNDDWMIFRKTDGNDAEPDGGIGFMMTNMSGYNKTVLKLDGYGNANFTNQEIITTQNVSAKYYFGNGSLLSSEVNYNHSDTKYYYNMSATKYYYNQSDTKYYYNQTQSPYYYNMSMGINGTYPWFRYLNVSGELIIGSPSLINISRTGKVGIGTASPTAQLHVVGKGIISTNLTVENTYIGSGPAGSDYATISYATLARSTTGWGFMHSSAGATFINAQTGQSIFFRIGNSDKVTINTSGKVGIGTNQPTHTLNVVGNGNFTTGVIGTSPGTTDNAGVKGISSLNPTMYGALGYDLQIIGVVAHSGVYGAQGGGGFAGYFNGQVYVTLNVSAQGFIDRSAWCKMNGTDALNTLANIQGKADGMIDKNTMPSCAVVESKTLDIGGREVVEKGRDIGAYISYLTIVAQEQQKENAKLKSCIASSRTFDELKVCSGATS